MIGWSMPLYEKVEGAFQGQRLRRRIKFVHRTKRPVISVSFDLRTSFLSKSR